MRRVEYPFNQLLPAGANDKNDRGIALLIPGLSHLIHPYLVNHYSCGWHLPEGPKVYVSGLWEPGNPFCGGGIRWLGPDGSGEAWRE